MERGRGRTRCAVGGGVSLGVGTLLFALCSPSSVSCATNLVVLTGGTVTAKSCAAYSVAAHVGVGLLVLGAVLLTGAFVLTVLHRRTGTDRGDGAPSVRGARPDARTGRDTAREPDTARKPDTARQPDTAPEPDTTRELGTGPPPGAEGGAGTARPWSPRRRTSEG